MFRKFIAAVVFVLGFSGAAHAQIPVTDVAHITATQMSHIESIAKYIEQITQLRAQLDQARATYNSISGLRNIGSLMNNQLLSQYLPADYQQAFNALRSGQGGSMAGVSGNLNQIAAYYQAQNCQQGGGNTTPQAQQACKQAWQTLSMNQYVAEEGYKQSAQNIQNLQQFVNSINSSSDAKSMQDLQARIAVEQVKLDNERAKLQTVAMMQKAQEDMERRNQGDRVRQMLSTGTEIRF
jgi:type IV secretion system protein VirB5